MKLTMMSLALVLAAPPLAAETHRFTPTVFVDKTGSKKLTLVGKSGFVPTLDEVTQAFDAALAG